MSRSPGARRRHTIPTRPVYRIRTPATVTLPPKYGMTEGRVRHVVEKRRRQPFWVSCEIVMAPIGPMGLPTGDNLIRKPGATARRLVDNQGRVGYCHAQQYEQKVKELADEREQNRA